MSHPHTPEGYHSVTPSLTVKNAAAALDFYAKAFGAVESYRLPDAKGKIMHAEFRIGDSTLMLSDEFPEWEALAPPIGKGGCFRIYVADVDQAYYQAIGVGASALREPEDMFWGDRQCSLYDPFGYRWHLATCVRKMTPAEIREAARQWT